MTSFWAGKEKIAYVAKSLMFVVFLSVGICVFCLCLLTSQGDPGPVGPPGPVGERGIGTVGTKVQ